ncbi:unnamed protein product [Moneuplotes crassus]|uniref:Uncharacterized protein n=1 Tax=Euplotes crassus TaxID=5936 RepID=A0AAD1UF59_EUPCR|nr:unnamed protein product [Moneuplotes crassus]
MDYQDCQHEGCNIPAVFYIEDKKLYGCSQHRVTHYLEFPFIALIDTFVVKKRVGILDEKRKEFVAFAENLNNGACSEEYQSLSDTIKEELQLILENLKKAISAGKHFKYESLYKEVGNVENLFSEDKEYISVIKAWSKGLTQARLEDQRSIELIKVELKQKYESKEEPMNRSIRKKYTNIGVQGAKINEMTIQQEQRNRQIEKSFSKSMMKLKEKEAEIEDLRELNQTLLEDCSNENKALEEKVKILVENLKEIQNENVKLTEEAKKAECDFDELMQSLTSNLSTSDYSDFSLLYKTKIIYYYWVESTVWECVYIEIDKFDLNNIHENYREVKTFIANCFPNKVRELIFNYGTSQRCSLSFYLEELVGVSQRVTGALYICNFEVSQDQLVPFFSANRHKELFGFPYCKLDLSSAPYFGGSLAGSTLEGLVLDGCFGSLYGGCSNNESHFENLIAGLSQEEDFRKNLQNIYMLYCGIEKNVVKNILANHGFGHVEIGSHSK